ncbi:hypothetical protein KC340_g2176 [Hortaea werneckii]|nr:hypothetical protein KC342_g7459 [Hortaea werneckii]KAI7107868.1 hypothetical protein KC339_g2016 [Hortaea werneckii]KAI7244470.1 hypothetical protein KC365_g1387 [Hortaea werneckii]KAI7335160.1 hypothetical protein KC340_g2176 [Hortaea werneckii]KAI7397017.1 hypothetical protein KC328_g5091 [Hortaea werneckii]
MPRVLLSSNSEFESLIGYSRAIVVDDWVMVSGTTGYDYATGVISPKVEDQAQQTLQNISNALADAGSCMDEVVRVNYILPNGVDFEKTWPVLRQWFGESRPAATMLQANLMKEEMKIEIEVTAKKGSANSNAL